MSNELKPCPFCGNTDEDNFSIPDLERVSCDVCGAVGPFDGADPIAAWNKRAKEEAL